MALFFLSYRRTDSPQACRIYDWLTLRFGEDAVFMDVENISFAEEFPERIRYSILGSKTMIALIGEGWQERTHEPQDWVRMEIETALSRDIPILPLLIGNTPMPHPNELPDSISRIADINAFAVGVSRDFDNDMQSLIPHVKNILRSLAKDGALSFGKHVIERMCFGTMEYLKRKYDAENEDSNTRWTVVSAEELSPDRRHGFTLFLHRVTRWADVLELHLLLTCWGRNAVEETVLTDWLMWKLDESPVIPGKHYWESSEKRLGDVRIRHSHEDAREVWRMVTDAPFHLSLNYIATISASDEHPAQPGDEPTQPLA